LGAAEHERDGKTEQQQRKHERRRFLAAFTAAVKAADAPRSG
jgi:hypothetical protein